MSHNKLYNNASPMPKNDNITKNKNGLKIKLLMHDQKLC